MTRLHLSIALLLAGLAGCEQAVPPGTKTPHDGTLVVLPDNQGFVEVLKRTDPSKEGQTQVVFFFLDESRKPMKPAPDTANLKLQTAGARPIELAPGDESSMVGPASPDAGEVSGTLSATVGGKSITVPIRAR
jgi:hypothetical protein